MEKEIKFLLRIISMAGIGISAGLINKIGLWFVIPWIICWLIYDYSVGVYDK